MFHFTKIQFRLALALVACLAGTALAAPVAAKRPADRITALEQRLEQSQLLIERLAAQVQALQAQVGKQPTSVAATAPANAAPPAASADSERLATVERDLAQMTAAAANRSTEGDGVPLHGFADVGAGSHNPVTAGLKGADVGSVDFYLAPQLGAKSRALVELNFEVSEEGSVGVDLERAQLGYQFGNAGTAWVGRFHTPYGYYNTAFHHGQQIATSLRRPRFLAFEDQGGIMPAHTVGMWFTGTRRTGEGRVGYDFYVGNAQSILDGTIDMRNAGNSSGQLSVGGRLYYQLGGSLDGLQFGVSALSARITDEQVAANLTRLNVLGAHVAFDSDHWENMLEYYHFSNESIAGDGAKHSSNAGFVQLARRAGDWTPYVRYERTQLDQADGYFAGQASGGSYHREALGLRFDIDLKSSLKLELADTHFTDRTQFSYSDVLTQYAVRF